MMEKGERIKQETRSFNADDGTSFTLRTKEEADDYRYFTDPDLPPFLVSEEWINDIKNKMPELPEVIASRYMTQFALSEYDAMQLTDDKSTSEYFESLIQHTNQYKAAANWILGPVKSLLNESNLSIEKMRIPASSLAKIIDLVESRVINFSSASSRLLPVLMEQPDKDPGVLIKELNLSQVGDTEVVEEWVNAALMKMPDKVAEYKKGKKGLLGLFVGEVKKMSKGKADPKLVNDLLMEKLNQKV
jgi:aspartyl-tRNA(Asn)/glutamyl-tRNA(Gln) amidotransferase subunit B